MQVGSVITHEFAVTDVYIYFFKKRKSSTILKRQNLCKISQLALNIITFQAHSDVTSYNTDIIIILLLNCMDWFLM